jgi:hypothetical protein
MLYPDELGGSFRLLLPMRMALVLRRDGLWLHLRHAFSRRGLDISDALATRFEAAVGRRTLVTITAPNIIAVLIGR